jgi:hypothetical protein
MMKRGIAMMRIVVRFFGLVVPVDAGDPQPSLPESFIAAAPDPGEEHVDTIAGSEFLDDRLRLGE